MSWDLAARRTRRDMAVLVIGFLMGMLALVQSAQAASFPVSDGNDAPLAAPGTQTTCMSTDGNCTLRAAIQAADNLGGASTIVLQPGTYSLSIPAAAGASQTDDPASGDLDIEETNGATTEPQVTVTAVPGSSDAGATTIDAAQVDRVFTVHASAGLTIDGITVKNGSQPGGAAPSDRSDEATDGGAILGEGAVTVENSVVRDSSAGHEGGAIYAFGDLTIENSTFTGNQATLGGGAIAYTGAGTGNLNLTDDTIALNQAGGRGGGVGFFANATTTAGVIRNVTIVGNTAPDGGGLAFPTEVGTIENSIIAENSGSPAMGGANDCFESFIGGNADEAGAADHGGNIDSDGSCFSASTPHDLTSSDPNVGQLAENGGPTPTAALPAGSPAIGLAIAADCPTTDQRGDARLAGFCDAGAFQSVDADLSVQGSGPSAAQVGQQITETFPVANAGPNGAAVVFTDPLPSGLTLISGTPSCSGTTTVSCSLGPLAAGATSTVSLTLKASGTGSQTNTATVSAIPLDPNVKNNSASVVTAVTEDPPVNLTPPTISGGHQVGDELTVDPGTWTNNPDLHWSWTLPGADSNSRGDDETLTLEPLDVGGTVSLTVTATNAAGQASARSAKTAEIEPAPVNVTVGRPQDNGPTVSVPIGCADDISCVVTLLLTALGFGGGQSADMATVARVQPRKPVVVGKKTVTIKARKRKKVRLTLNHKGRKLLAKNHKLKVSAQITERGHRTRTLKITFKANRPKH
jgi:uncharacterized repeat protein (TIGR01451 family)